MPPVFYFVKLYSIYLFIYLYFLDGGGGGHFKTYLHFAYWLKAVTDIIVCVSAIDNVLIIKTSGWKMAK